MVLHWCSTAWPILVKAVHTHMVDKGLYEWRDVARRARCLYGEFFNLHGELHTARAASPSNRRR